MHVWQLQEAKAKLTQLMNEAKQEPQIISRHGVNETVVMSMKQYEKLTSKGDDIVSFFKHSPLYGLNLEDEIKRDRSSHREIDL